MSLLQMPKKVLERIVKDCEYPEIQALRKVCRDLRNFIEEYEPNYQLRRIEIELRGDQVLFELYTNAKTTRYMRFRYRKNEDGCMITSDKFVEEKRNLVRCDDSLAIFFGDLRHILINQRISLESFHLGFVHFGPDDRYAFWSYEIMEENSIRMLNFFEDTLKSRIRPIMIEDFQMKGANQEEIMRVLPLVDHKELRRIQFQNSYYERSRILELDQIMKTDQWKCAKKLAIWNFNVCEDWETFKHFDILEVFNLQEILKRRNRRTKRKINKRV